MKGKKIISALQHIDPELIEEAAEATASVNKKSTFRCSTLIAACLCLVCSLSAVWLAFKLRSDPPGTQGDNVIIATGETPTDTSGAEGIPTEASPIETTAGIVETGASIEGSIESAPRIALIKMPFYPDGDTIAWNACSRFCEDYPFAEWAYYQTQDESVESCIDTIEQVIMEGYNILVFPVEDEYTDVIAEAVMETADMYPEGYYLVVGISKEDMREDYELPLNICCISFQEEVAGFMAGVAAVRMGYTNLGFLGSVEMPGTLRYGYGFVQGAEYAARLTDTKVEMKYAYANSMYSDAELTDDVAAWYAEGTEVIFACGTGISLSVAEAAAQAEGMIIEVKMSHSYSDTDYGYGPEITLTSVVENLDKTIYAYLESIIQEDFEFCRGQYLRIGLYTSEEPESNFMALSEYTQFGEGFTIDDYTDLIEDLINGTIQVSDDIGSEPVTSYVTVDYLDPLKE